MFFIVRKAKMIVENTRIVQPIGTYSFTAVGMFRALFTICTTLTVGMSSAVLLSGSGREVMG